MTARLHVDLAALVANYRTCNAAARPHRCGAVVKANAYGLGAAQVAPALWSAGCRAFFVAEAAEGRALRRVLPEARIFVFGGATETALPALLEADLVPVLNHPGQFALWLRHGRARAAAVQVDTGMNRLGFDPGLRPQDLPGLAPELLLTHLACADDPAHALNEAQLRRFARVCERFPGVPTSIGNSAGVLHGPARTGDLGRPGIALYGGNPYLTAPSPVRAVATLEGQILQLRRVARGEVVGYGASYRAERDMEVAVVGLGYADGLPRLLSNRGAAALGEHRCRVVGRVSMDLTNLDVTGVGAREGDWLEFLGRRIGVDEVAAWAHTIPYEVLTGLGRRAERRYHPV